MTTQEWLEGYKYYEKLLIMLKERKKELLWDNIHITSYPKDIAIRSSQGNLSEEKNIKYLSAIEEIDNQIDEISKEVSNTRKVIWSVTKPQYKMLLIARYIEGKSWEDIAETMECSEKWLRETLNSRAIKEVEKIRKLS